jgi:iron complex outermembrane receptor protein
MQLLARGMICCCLTGVAFAATSNDILPSQPLTTEIPAEPLPQALKAFAEQTGLQLAYVSTLTEGKVSQLAPAGLPPAATLKHLLAGTGLSFTFVNGRTVSLFETPTGRAAPARVRLTVPPTNAATGIPEVVVTATKREELLRDVPVTATVFSGAFMIEAGVKSIVQIAAMAPGVEYDFNAQWGGGVLTNISIRGVDSKVGASTTGIYIDDVPIQDRNGNFGNPYPVTFDLARVEVLRGPQATLFGAGAEGGAIRFIPNEASTTNVSVLSRSEVAHTQFGAPSYEVGVAAGGPLIVGTVGARLSIWYRDEGGYIDRVDPFTGAIVDKNSNAARTEAFRLGFAVESSESLRITPSFGYQSLKVGDTSSFYENLSNPSAGALRTGKLLSQPIQDSFTHANIKLEYHSGDTNLTAVTSYFDRMATASIDTTNEAGADYLNGFGNPLGPAYPTSYADAVPTLTSLHQIALSQEVRLMSSEPDAPLRWMAGLFYSRSQHDERLYTYLIAAPTNPGIDSTEGFTDTLTSGFGSLEWLFLPGFKTRLGLRIDNVRSVFTQHTAGFVTVGSPPFSRGSVNENPLTPRFDFDYENADHNLIYASIAKGFRVGGNNSVSPIQCGTLSLPSSYASDSVWSYELGTKRHAFDDHLQLAAAAFYLRWHNIQEHEVPPCQVGFVANAGDAIGKGFDLSADATLQDKIKIGLAVEDLDMRYTKTVALDGNVIVDRGAVVGGVPHVPPPWSAAAYFRYEWPVRPGLQAYVRADETVHSHNPGPFSELDLKSISYSPRFTADPATYLLNLRVGFDTSHWNTQLFVDNALNSLPVLQRNADSGPSSLIYAYTFRPRTVGISGNWTF